MDIVLRFSYNDTDTNFYWCDVLSMTKKVVQKSKIYRIEHDGFDIFGKTEYGYEYKLFTVKFNLMKPDVFSKLETLQNYKDSYEDPAILNMYYEYGIEEKQGISDGSKTICEVQMYRDDFIKKYYKGYVKADETATIKFIETISEGDAIELFNPVTE